MIDIDNLRLMIEKAAEEAHVIIEQRLELEEYANAEETYIKLIEFYKYIIDKVFTPCIYIKPSTESVPNAER